VSAKQVLSDVLRTIDGVLYTDPETGLIGVWLLQSANGGTYGYDIFNEYTLDASVIRSVEWTESAPDAQANEVKVEFVDRARDYTEEHRHRAERRGDQALGRDGIAHRVLPRRAERRRSRRGWRTASSARSRRRSAMRRSSVTGRLSADAGPVLHAELGRGREVDAPHAVHLAARHAVRHVRDRGGGGRLLDAGAEYRGRDDAGADADGGTPAITPYGYIEATTTGTTTGNTTLFLYDPTAAVTLVEYRTQSGTGAFSGWTTDTYPYQASVTLDPFAASRVEWRVTYTDGAGASQTLTFAHTFDVDATAAAAAVTSNASAIAAETTARIAGDAAQQAYTDAKVAGLSWKQQVRAATTVAGTLASSFENGDAIDGVTLATGDRILIKNQAAGAENGLYVVAASGAPTRATDADSGAELVNATCYVSEGTANADTQWTCSTNAPITLGSTSLAFAQSGAGSFGAQSANSVYAGPPSGGAAVPTFRALTAADIPALDAAKITSGVMAIARLATGTPDGTKFIRDDGTLAVPTSSVGWRYLAGPGAISSGNTRDAVSAAFGNNGATFLISVTATRLAYRSVATFVVTAEAIFSPPSAWGIVRPHSTDATGGIGLEVRMSAAQTIEFRIRNESGGNFDGTTITITSVTDNTPTWTALSATAALATTAYWGGGRVLLGALEQAGATSRQGMLWDNTNKLWVPSTILTTDVSGISAYAPLASPAFTGVPTAPTPSVGTNTTQLATTAMVTAAVAAAGIGAVPAWVTLHPDNAPGTANVADDEFSTGSTLDTAGSRFSGANAWTWIGGSAWPTDIQFGVLGIIPNANSSTFRSPTQPLPASPWKYRMKCMMAGWAVSDGLTGEIGLSLYESSTGKATSHGPSYSAGTERLIASSTSSYGAALGSKTVRQIGQWWYIEIEDTGSV
jgi:hypothetical protein